MATNLHDEPYVVVWDSTGWFVEKDVGSPLVGPYQDEQHARDMAAALNLGHLSRIEKGQIEPVGKNGVE